jgi:anti-sigma factor RsiW
VTRDELEFSISQYLDGTLAAGVRDALDERLARDAEARAILAEYRSLQGVLASSPMPVVKWDNFAARISSAVSREELPAQSYKISAWLRPARLAIAASLLLGIGAAVALLNNPVTTPVAPTLIRVVDATTELPKPQPIEIAISPPAASSDTRIVMHVEDQGIVHRPSRAMIVSATPVAQDTFLTPY